MISEDINQTQLAMKLDKSKSQISKYFSCESGVPIDEIPKILNALNYSIIENEKYKSLLQESKELTELKLKGL